MAWIVKLVSLGAEGEEHSTDVMRIAKPDDLTDLASLGLTLAEGKRLLASVQREIVAAQARVHAARRPACPGCGGVCRVKDYRQHGIATLFGQVRVWLPRFRCGRCGVTETGVGWPSHVRSTPELDRLRAQFSALMTYRSAAEMLAQLFPVDAGADPETLRRHIFKVAGSLPVPATAEPASPAEAIVVTLDSTFIRSCEEGERHIEVRIGNVETTAGRRQVFGAVAKTDTDPAALIRRSLDAVGRTRGTVLTAFTDGCPGLRRLLFKAGVNGLPILDWFHVAMRLQHLTQIAGGLSSDDPERAAAKAVIAEEVERLRWRLWNGKAKDAGISIDCIRAVMHHFRGEPGSHRSIAPSRKLWTALRALDSYLVGQSDWLVDYGERHRAGLRAGTALTEGTANFRVNRSMNKSQGMRWSRRGADRLLQVRCAVYNGTLGTGFGQRFSAANDYHLQAAIAA
ncbi:ISKra4 family transposase [Roseomonas chloroacetimidivorans]|uniref:ISKra4 family transposase n=1 Tax=Roseomonas chloroacetimidivorans TaxID=1766656 RepID=UPI003C713A82